MSEDLHCCLHTMQPSVSQSTIKFHSPSERSSIITLWIRHLSYFVDKAAIQFNWYYRFQICYQHQRMSMLILCSIVEKKDYGNSYLVISKYIPLIIMNVYKYCNDNYFHNFRTFLLQSNPDKVLASILCQSDD